MNKNIERKESFLRRLINHKQLAKDYREYIDREENPRKYLAAGFFIYFSNLLILTFWICTPWAVISLYIFARNYNSSWDSLVIAVFFGYSVVISIFISIIMLAGIALTKKKKLFVILLISFFICSAGGLASYGIGSLQWRADFNHCRTEIQSAILELEKYKAKNGTYPEKISDAIGKELILYRGFNQVDVDYCHDGSTFSITYMFGYGYTYKSMTKAWEGWD